MDSTCVPALISQPGIITAVFIKRQRTKESVEVCSDENQSGVG